eukprot:497179-Pelagomonas_calceolata.AAC.7
MGSLVSASFRGLSLSCNMKHPPNLAFPCLHDPYASRALKRSVASKCHRVCRAALSFHKDPCAVVYQQTCKKLQALEMLCSARYFPTLHSHKSKTFQVPKAEQDQHLEFRKVAWRPPVTGGALFKKGPIQFLKSCKDLICVCCKLYASFTSWTIMLLTIRKK